MSSLLVREPPSFMWFTPELMSGPIKPNSFVGHLEGGTTRVLTDEQINDENLSKMKESVTWGRRLIRQTGEEAEKVEAEIGTILVSQRPIRPRLSLTYVGHSPLSNMVLHQPHLYVDTGAFLRNDESKLLIVKHHDVLAALKQLD